MSAHGMGYKVHWNKIEYIVIALSECFFILKVLGNNLACFPGSLSSNFQDNPCPVIFELMNDFQVNVYKYILCFRYRRVTQTGKAASFYMNVQVRKCIVFTPPHSPLVLVIITPLLVCYRSSTKIEYDYLPV